MNFKTALSLILCFVLIFSLSACGDVSDPTISVPDEASSGGAVSEEEPEAKGGLNPLTGEYNLKNDAVGKRPVAITVNNVSVAQSVQTGVGKADVIFEVEVEGGITRLLALFADPTDVGKIGTIRSMRVPFAEIVCGMDAILFYHGMDEVHCRPHVKSLGLDYMEIDTVKYGGREKNGLAYEHTLYTSGDKLDAAIADKKFDTEGSEKPWLNFRSEDEKASAGEQSVKKASITFNGASTTQFIYDDADKKYVRAKKDTPYTDYVTGEQEKFTNVFVLNTKYTSCTSDKCHGANKSYKVYHRFADLTSGSGWYISAGGAVEIKWSKGDSANNFTFTNTDGSELTVNSGNSYVCLVNASTSKITME